MPTTMGPNMEHPGASRSRSGRVVGDQRLDEGIGVDIDERCGPVAEPLSDAGNGSAGVSAQPS